MLLGADNWANLNRSMYVSMDLYGLAKNGLKCLTLRLNKAFALLVTFLCGDVPSQVALNFAVSLYLNSLWQEVPSSHMARLTWLRKLFTCPPSLLALSLQQLTLSSFFLIHSN
eukprot:1158959-Pelagomonas_calceolata.AAC.9